MFHKTKNIKKTIVVVAVKINYKISNTICDFKYIIISGVVPTNIAPLYLN